MKHDIYGDNVRIVVMTIFPIVIIWTLAYAVATMIVGHGFRVGK